jgi:hypothetical protein
MISARLRIIALALIFSLFSNLAIADAGFEPEKKVPPVAAISHPGPLQEDSALVAAVQSKQSQFYVEGGNLVVTHILPDDTQGLPHQKWEAQLSDGSIIMVVYNSNMGERIPVEEGMTFSVGGQFIWTQDGGLIHWVHADPKKKRPDGFVFINDALYGAAETEPLTVH